MEKATVLCATGFPQLDAALVKKGDVDVVASCRLKSEIRQNIETYHPDILMFTDKISGDEDLIRLIINLKKDFPSVRFIYFAGELKAKDNQRRDMLGTLVLVGIYDILLTNKINYDIVIDIIEHPKSPAAVEHLTVNLLDKKSEYRNAHSELKYDDFEESVNKDESSNVYLFTSIKPGTGKSFVSSNVAAAIAKYGANNPKVALIEADLQTLSIGTILDIDDDTKNLKTAMEAISTLFDAKGNLIDDQEKIRKANRKVKDCFIKYKSISNLEVLVGSALTPDAIDNMRIKPHYYTYLINLIKDDYDIVIVDLNSSIYQAPILGLLSLATKCYYILNLDFNNIRNNIRYKETIKSFGIQHKVEYILNQDIRNEDSFDAFGINVENLYFTAKEVEENCFNLAATIQALPQTVFLNRIHEGTPVVLDGNEITYTNKPKLQILQFANTIRPIKPEEISKLEELVGDKKPSKFSFRRKPKE